MDALLCQDESKMVNMARLITQKSNSNIAIKGYRDMQNNCCRLADNDHIKQIYHSSLFAYFPNS